MRHRAIHWCGVLMLISTMALGDSTYAPKLTVGFGNGILRNQGLSGGSAATIGEFNLSVTYFFTPRISLGAGYHLDFDYSRSLLPISGFDFSSRFYFFNQGTRSREELPEITSTRRDPMAMYLAANVSQQSYYFGTRYVDGSPQQLSGTSLNVGPALGADFAISDTFDVNTEASVGVFSFAASDTSYRIASLLLKIGLSYLW